MNLHCVFEELDVINKLMTDSAGFFKSDGNVDFFSTSSPLLRSVCQEIFNDLDTSLSDVKWWKCLQSLLELFMMADDLLAEESLISVKNKGIVRKACQHVVWLGVVPFLSFRVPPWSPIPPTLFNIPPHQKELCVELVMRVVMKVGKGGFVEECVRHQLGPLMAGCLHLVLMTPPPPDIHLFKEYLMSLLDDIHQPHVFTQLMLLTSALGKEGKVSRVVRSLLVQKVEREKGVETLAVATLTADSPTSDVIKMSHLLANKHTSHFYQRVLPQVLALLSHKEEKMRQVSANCFCLVYDKDKEVFEKLLVEPLLAPLRREAGEEEVEECLRRLDGLGCSERGRVPWPVLSQAVAPLAVALGVSRETSCGSFVTSVIKACLDQAPADLLSDVMLKFIFPEATGTAFRLGGSGGLETHATREPPTWKADQFVALLSGKHKAQLFTSLLSVVSKGSVEQRMMSAQLLSSLSSDKDVLASLSSEPAPLISFLCDLLVDPSDTDSLLLGLALLNIIIEDKLMQRKRNWKLFDRLIEPLEKLKTSSLNPETRVLSDEIYTALVTRGIVRLKVEDDEPTQTVDVSDYEKAMEEINDAHLPVRAHAIRQLSKLVASKNRMATRNRQMILALFKENLKNDDSYMYLSCIEGLSVIAAQFPDEVLKTLCDQFIHGKDIKLRLKVGEAVVKTTRNMGERVSAYKDELIGMMLRGVGDDDPLVRASCLSNIGELCQILSFRISSHIIQIFDCIQVVFDTDKFLEPKRAAVLVTMLLFKGLGSDVFTVLEPILLDLYRKLKLIYKMESDDVTKLHAQIALEELTSSTVKFLFHKEIFRKHIFTLDPPT